MKIPTIKKIKGELFVARDGNGKDGGYYRLFFKTEDGKTIVLSTFCGGGYYADVFFEDAELESEATDK